MATKHHGVEHENRYGRRDARTDHPVGAASSHHEVSSSAERLWAVLRILVGVEFLWAFLDKTFGWGYATPAGEGWIAGGSPTRGFLEGVSVGPFASIAPAIAGAAWADWLFMIGLAGIGIALIAGVAMRVAAVSGAVLLMLMWLAVWPPATTTSAGEPTMSTNPIVDYHLIEAVVLIVLATVHAGRTWGLGRFWESLPFVRRTRWLA